MSSRFAFLICAVLVMTGLGICSCTTALRSEPAPEWQLKDLDGKTVKLSDFKGKVVVLNFWATWCPPCVEEIPGFIAVQKEFQDKGVVVVGISGDSINPAEVAAFATKQGMNYPIVMATDDVLSQYDPEAGFPLTVIVDPAGKLVARHLGRISQDALEAQIKNLLAAAPPAKT